MYVSDVIIPRLIARKHRRESGNSPENLIRAAKDYKHRLETFYSTKALRKIRKNLFFLRKRIAPLEIDHQNFLDAIQKRILEIEKMEGVSEQDKEDLKILASTKTLYVVEKKDKKIELVWDRIIKPKNIICNQANRIISSKKHRIECLKSDFRYRFTNYKSVLNKHIHVPEIERMELNLPDINLILWDYESPKSIPDDEYLILGED